MIPRVANDYITSGTFEKFSNVAKCMKNKTYLDGKQ